MTYRLHSICKSGKQLLTNVQFELHLGIVGSVLAKEGSIPTVSDIFSGAFKVYCVLTA